MRRLLRCLVAASLVALLSSCQLIVAFDTHLNANGSGTFTVAMSLDAQALQIVRAPRSRALFDTLEGLFASLKAKGWKINTNETAQGRDVSATSSFSSPSDFDRVMTDLRAAGFANGASGGFALNLSVSARNSFLRSSQRFGGSIDTRATTAPPAIKRLLALAGNSVQIDVLADLPGGIGTIDGNGTLAGHQILWQPSLGSVATFGARASSFHLWTLLAILLPLIAVFAGLAFFFLARKPKERGAPTIGTPVERTPRDEFLAFKPDAPPEDDVRAELDEMLQIEPPDEAR